MKPLRDNVLVQQMAAEQVTDGGIVLTGSAATGARAAKVIAVGSEVVDVAVGNTVYPDWKEAKAVTIDDVQMAVVCVKDIMAVLDE